MLVVHPLFNLIVDILPRDTMGWLRSYKRLSGAVPCKLVSSFISTYPGMSRDPVQPHGVPGRDIIQCIFGTVVPVETLFGSQSAFRATQLSEQIQAYFFGLP